MSDIYKITVDHDGKTESQDGYGNSAIEAIGNAIPNFIISLDRVEEVSIKAKRIVKITGQDY